MALNSVYGSVYNVHSILYDAAGRVGLRRLGNDQIRTDYQYQPWTTQGGRLQRLLSGTPNGDSGVTANLQNFTYNYDANGNVSSIAAGLSGGTQTQSFTYDALDRLFTAAATGGTGGLYSQSYSYYFSDGRMANGPAGTTYNYANAAHPHAVTSVGANTYGYDANGNMITRTVGSNTYLQSYDAENRLAGVTGTATASFVYDGDNNRVKGTVGGVTTVYVGNLYEVQGSSSIKKYYYAGNQRVAMRDSGVLRWLLGDHLGSTTYVVSGTVESGETRYLPWGQNRYTSGTTPTSYKYTGQREEASLGLYYYGARWYDPALGRFIQPDTIVPNPGNVQSFDRYAYTLNNPLKYTDPTGHFTDDAIQDYLKETHKDAWEEYWKLWSADVAWMDMLHQAMAGDIFASVSTGSGLVSWHQFAGEGVTSLTGANEINLNGGTTLFAGVMLDVLRPSSNGTIAGGLLRANADNSFQLVPTLPSPDSNLALGLHTVGWLESVGWRGARAAGITGVGTGVVWAAEKLTPLTASVTTIIGFVTEFTIEEISDDLGYQQGDQQVRLRQLTTNYKGRFDTRQVATWWYRPPLQSRFE